MHSLVLLVLGWLSTIGKELPEGFQRSEFLLEHGFLDAIVERKDLKEKLAFSLRAMGDFPKVQ